MPAPLYQGMRDGTIVRFEEITRCPLEVQDLLLAALSDRVMAIPELEDGKQLFAKVGFNVWPRSVGEATHDAVLELLEAPDRLAAFGAAARASAVGRFTPDQVVPRYEAVYRRVVEAGGSVA